MGARAEELNARILRVPVGSALVAAVQAIPKCFESPPGAPAILADMISEVASKRLSGALKVSLPRRAKASAWRWSKRDEDVEDSVNPLSRAFPALEARRQWQEAAEMEENPGAYAEAMVNVFTTALPPALLEEVVRAYASDSFFSSGEATRRGCVREGPLWLKKLPLDSSWRLVIPNDEAVKKTLFQVAHSSSMAGHRDAKETLRRLRAVAWWPAMYDEITKMVAECYQCARAKHRTRALRGKMQAIDQPSSPFVHVHIDAAAGLPLSEGYDQCWVVVDRFTRFVFLVPGKASDTAGEVAERLLERVFSLVGLPQMVTSDGEPRINGSFFSALYARAGVRHRCTAPRRSQGNGLAERTIRTLRAYLRTTADVGKQDWVRRLSDAQFVFNSSAASVHGFSPAKLLFGIEPRGPLHLTLPSDLQDASDAADWLRTRQFIQAEALSRAMASQVEMLKAANRSREDAPSFEAGQLVFVDAERVADPAEAHLPVKLRSPYSGPYQILAVSDSNLTVALSPLHGKEK